MNYNIVIIDSDCTLNFIKSNFFDFEELLRFLYYDPSDFLKLDSLHVPVDVFVLRLQDIRYLHQFVKKIKELSHFAFIPIIIVDDSVILTDLLHQDFDLVDVISENHYFDKAFITARLLFMCKATAKYKRLRGENTIIKTKLLELEKLRIKNDFLFSSTKTLEELNQQLIFQRDEIEKQKHEIENEKKRSEDLLKNILPEETSRELMIHGEAKTQYYKKVSVLFSDFQGFTRTCENMRPQEIVKELATHFSKFEEFCDEHYVEKIKTIGDAYMCAGGIPMRNNSNPIDVVLVGLEIVRYIEISNKSKTDEGLKTWDLRIGIHTGSLIAGVIGKKKFAYDIWGDTVNTASRMETSGEINKVNISGDTYDYVKDFFVCIYRGKIEAKNKGLIDMYFVVGIKPELSVNGDGVIPNKEFITEYSKL